MVLNNFLNFICLTPETDVSEYFINVENLKLYQLKRLWKNGFGIWKIIKENDTITMYCFQYNLIEYTKIITENELQVWTSILNQLPYMPTDLPEKLLIENTYKEAETIIKDCEYIKYLEDLTPAQVFQKCCLECQSSFKNYCAFYILKGEGITPKKENYAISKTKLWNYTKNTFSNYPFYTLGAYQPNLSIEQNTDWLDTLYKKLVDKNYDVIKYPLINTDTDDKMYYSQYQLLILGNYLWKEFDQENELENIGNIAESYFEKSICYKPIFKIENKETTFDRDFWYFYGTDKTEGGYKKLSKRGITNPELVSGYIRLNDVIK